MDKLNINKEEMSHPIKHIIVNKNKAVMIDFERTRYTQKPGNITQFCDFLISNRVSKLLKNNNIKIDKMNIIKKSKIYKKNIDNINLKKIIDEIG